MTGQLDGVLLSEIIGQPLGAATAIPILCHVCDLVTCFHERGLAHGDLQPSSIWLCRCEGNLAVQLLDFGSTQRLEPRPPAWPFSAPERANGLQIDRRADVYSLGAIAFQLATGHAPSRGTGGAVTPHELDQSVSKEWSSVIMGAMAVDPGARYPSAAAFKRALLEVRAPAPRLEPFTVMMGQRGEGEMMPARCTRLTSTGMFVDAFPQMPAVGAQLHAVLSVDGITLACECEVVLQVTDAQATEWGMTPGLAVSFGDQTSAAQTISRLLRSRA